MTLAQHQVRRTGLLAGKLERLGLLGGTQQAGHGPERQGLSESLGALEEHRWPQAAHRVGRTLAALASVLMTREAEGREKLLPPCGAAGRAW